MLLFTVQVGGRKEGTYLFDNTTMYNMYQNRMVRRLSLRLNISASATATEIVESLSGSCCNIGTMALCLFFHIIHEITTLHFIVFGTPV